MERSVTSLAEMVRQVRQARRFSCLAPPKLAASLVSHALHGGPVCPGSRNCCRCQEMDVFLLILTFFSEGWSGGLRNYFVSKHFKYWSFLLPRTRNAFFCLVRRANDTQDMIFTQPSNIADFVLFSTETIICFHVMFGELRIIIKEWYFRVGFVYRYCNSFSKPLIGCVFLKPLHLFFGFLWVFGLQG